MRRTEFVGPSPPLIDIRGGAGVAKRDRPRRLLNISKNSRRNLLA